jgi:RyR domain
MGTYEPRPIDTSNVKLSEPLLQLTEQLAENAHDNWARRRLSEGWTWGPARDDAAKKHPDLVPYGELSEEEKQYDRDTAMETLRAILALGYQIRPGSPPAPDGL